MVLGATSRPSTMKPALPQLNKQEAALDSAVLSAQMDADAWLLVSYRVLSAAVLWLRILLFRV